MHESPFLNRIIDERATLSRGHASSLMRAILAGELSDLHLAALLGAMAARGETPEELAGFVDVMREAVTPIPLTDDERAGLVDTCGTGGDRSGTFNISTASALVAAAAGATVAKHGNRAVTSRSGSADVLEALGIPVNLTPQQAAEALRRHRFVFLLAPSMHPAMKAVMPVRRALGVRTVFNVLGPLTNPAGARAQVMGVYSSHLVPVVAEAMVLLGMRHAMVVNGKLSSASGAGSGEMDEISTCGPTVMAEVLNGSVSQTRVEPAKYGLRKVSHEALHGSSVAHNAQILTAIFAGEPGAPREIVLLNAAAVLVVAGRVGSIEEGIVLAAETIDRGEVTRLVAALGG